MGKIFLSLCLFSFINAAKIEYEKNIDIVIDEQNKLMWQDNMEVTQYLEDYVTAKVYCENTVLSGYIDWRVPTIKEIQKIVDVNRKNAIHKSFKFIKPYMYSTQTLFKKDDKYLWGIDFKTGQTKMDLKKNKNYIRCVRDIV